MTSFQPRKNIPEKTTWAYLNIIRGNDSGTINCKPIMLATDNEVNSNHQHILRANTHGQQKVNSKDPRNNTSEWTLNENNIENWLTTLSNQLPMWQQRAFSHFPREKLPGFGTSQALVGIIPRLARHPGGEENLLETITIQPHNAWLSIICHH